jgi:hypothetical protein
VQTEEDKIIQENLECAGNGLPAIDALFLKYIGFPIIKKIMPWNIGMRLFEHEGRKILDSVKPLDDEVLFRKVLIPKTFGIEDNSRYYSPAMVLWHLIYVGQTIQEGIVSLSKNEELDFVVKIENFKPFVEISDNIVDEYEVFISNYKINIESNVKEKHIQNFHPHPWFGPLNPHQWLIMSAVHQIVHARQLKKILKENPK